MPQFHATQNNRQYNRNITQYTMFYDVIKATMYSRICSEKYVERFFNLENKSKQDLMIYIQYTHVRTLSENI
jgi:hypothetical protein